MKRIINLLGPSSAGKTTLMKALEKDQRWITVSGDEVVGKAHQAFDDHLMTTVFEKLDTLGLLIKLKEFMSNDEMVQFFTRGLLTLHLGEKVFQHKFQGPSLPELETILEQWGLGDLKNLLEQAAKEVSLIIRNTPLPPFIEMLHLIYTDAFRRLAAAPDGATVIADIVPLPEENSQVLLDDFKKMAEQYRQDHPGEITEAYNVLAICPPITISNRMDARNRKAEEENNPMDKRIGLFPLYQLSELIAVESPTQTLSKAPVAVTKDELFQIVRKHCLPEREEDQALVIENLDDPTALDPTAEETKTRIGTRTELREFASLSARLGLFSERARLAPKPQLQADVTINMAHGTPEQLAIQLVGELEQLSPAKLLVCAAGGQ